MVRPVAVCARVAPFQAYFCDAPIAKPLVYRPQAAIFYGDVVNTGRGGVSRGHPPGINKSTYTNRKANRETGNLAVCKPDLEYGIPRCFSAADPGYYGLGTE